MLSRKVVNRTGRGFRGYFPSKKLSRLVEFESILERDAIRLFENTDAVSRYQEQPTIVYYHDEDGLPRKYFPDFELEFTFGNIVHVEVKPLAILLKPHIALKYQAIHQHYAARPEHFVVLTEKEIRTNAHQDFFELINNTNLIAIKGDDHEKIFP